MILELNTSLRSVYCTFMRTILENNTVVLDPNIDTDSYQVKLVKRSFLKFDTYVLKIWRFHDNSTVL